MKHKSEHEARAWEMAMKTVRYYYDGWDLFKASIFGFVLGLIIGFLFGISTAYGSELKHSFKSPAFNGIGYSSHVLTIENLTFQRKQEIIAKKAAAQRELERELENTNINKFLKNFESRVYAELSKQLADQLFGEAASDSGTIDIMGNTIDYSSDGTTLTMTVSESNGTITTLELPLSGFGF